MHVIHIQNCSRSRPGYVAPPSECVVLFSLAVVFGEIRHICQCIPNSKFFQVDLFSQELKQNGKQGIKQ